MKCIICNKVLKNKYYIGKKSELKIFFCLKHGLVCNNNCENYIFENGTLMKI
ncbi:MAG: hypothetical protein QXZ43_00780 [Candidatus Aenigmatarchaeota archaeon]